MNGSLNGALPLYNTILAYVLHELSKAQYPMLLTWCAPALVLYCMYAYITCPHADKMSKMFFTTHVILFVLKHSIYSENTHIY